MTWLTRPGSSPAAPPGAALLWRRCSNEVTDIRVGRGNNQRQPHLRCWTEAPVIEEKAFRFRGPTASLNLQARTVASLLEIGEGVDDDTWLYHLRRGEYSSWLRHVIHDDTLANTVAAVETGAVTAHESRTLVATALWRWYRQ